MIAAHTLKSSFVAYTKTTADKTVSRTHQQILRALRTARPEKITLALLEISHDDTLHPNSAALTNFVWFFCSTLLILRRLTSWKKGDQPTMCLYPICGLLPRAVVKLSQGHLSFRPDGNWSTSCFSPPMTFMKDLSSHMDRNKCRITQVSCTNQPVVGVLIMNDARPLCGEIRQSMWLGINGLYEMVVSPHMIRSTQQGQQPRPAQGHLFSWLTWRTDRPGSIQGVLSLHAWWLCVYDRSRQLVVCACVLGKG